MVQVARFLAPSRLQGSPPGNTMQLKGLMAGGREGVVGDGIQHFPVLYPKLPPGDQGAHIRM